MWVFYLISLPLTLGMVTVTLWYFAGPHVPRYVLLTVGYAWFCSISVIILVPADIWTTIVDHEKGGIAFFWSWSYWSTFALTWAVVPTIQSYEDAGDFKVTERLKTSIRANLVFYVCVGSIGLLGLILLILMRGKWSGGIVGFAMACSNTFGLVTGAFLLGFGLSEIPKSIWRNADWSNCQKVLSHRVAKMAVNLDIAHQEFSNAIVIAQATSKQMSKRDFLRPYMDVIDRMLLQMMQENPSFKPSGGMFGENDMDYDNDDKTMAALRRRLRKAQEEYYRYRSEYITSIVEALELEDTVKNYDLRNSTGWRYVSSLRGRRANKFGPFLDTLELLWRCILRKQLEKLLAVILGCMSAAILLAEATILPSGFDLSFFSILINAVGEQEMLAQIVAFVPLMYMCICTYYSLFKIGMLMYYSLTPGQTNSVSLLMICSMVARYAPPISYNFLNLIRLRSNTKTIFEKRMGNIDDAVPFFGKGFNNIYPLIMVIYTILVASNFFGRVVEFFGRWMKFKFQEEEQDLDGYDPSGLIILQKERSWLEQGHKVGELIIPLARNFYETNEDVESACEPKDADKVKKEGVTIQFKEEGKGSRTEAQKEDSQRLGTSREADKPEAMREQLMSKENAASQVLLSLLDEADSPNKSSETAVGTSAKAVVSTWASMKTGFQNFKANMGQKKNFLPLHKAQGASLHTTSSSESLEDIFEKLKQKPSRNHADEFDFDDDGDDIPSRATR